MSSLGTSLRIDVIGNALPAIERLTKGIAKLKSIDLKVSTNTGPLKGLSNAIKTINKRINKINNRSLNINTDINGLNRVSNGLDRIKNSVKVTNRNPLSIPVNTAGLTKMNTGIMSTRNMMKEAGNNVRQFQNELITLIGTLGVGFVMPIQKAREYEDSLLDINRSLEMGGQQEKFLQRLMNLKSGTVKELSEISTIIAKSGVKDLEEVISMTEIFDKVSKALDLDPGPVTAAISKFLTINNKLFNSINVLDIADKITNLENEIQNVKASELADVMKRMSEGAQQIGLNTDTQMTISAGLLSRGVTPELDASKFRMFVNRLAIIDRKLGSDFETKISVGGFSGFKDAMRELGKLNLGEMQDVIGALGKKLVLTFRSEKALSELDHIMDVVKASKGSVQEEMDKYEKTFTYRYRSFIKKVANLSASFGKALTVDLTGPLKWMGSLFNIIRILIDRFPVLKRAIIYTTLALITLGPGLRLATLGFASFNPVIGMTIRLFSALKFGIILGGLKRLVLGVLTATNTLRIFRFVFSTSFIGPVAVALGAITLIATNFYNLANILRKVYNWGIAPIFWGIRNLMYDVGYGIQNFFYSILIKVLSVMKSAIEYVPRLSSMLGFDGTGLTKKIYILEQKKQLKDAQKMVAKDVDPKITKEYFDKSGIGKALKSIQKGSRNVVSKGINYVMKPISELEATVIKKYGPDLKFDKMDKLDMGGKIDNVGNVAKLLKEADKVSRDAKNMGKAGKTGEIDQIKAMAKLVNKVGKTPEIRKKGLTPTPQWKDIIKPKPAEKDVNAKLLNNTLKKGLKIEVQVKQEGFRNTIDLNYSSGEKETILESTIAEQEHSFLVPIPG